MKALLRHLPARLGVDNGADRYAYGDAGAAGTLAKSRVPTHWVRTTCGYCSVGCGMLLGVRDGVAVAVRGDDDHPVNRGSLCPKGLSEHLTIGAPGRLHHALIRRNSTLGPAPIGVALDEMTSRWQRVVEEHGRGAVAVISTGQLVTEEFYALGKLVRLGMGVEHFDGNTTLCMASAVSGYKMSFGADGPPGCYDDLAVADVIVLWGANITDNHPLLAPRLAGRRHGTVITIDPRITKTTTLADVHVALRARTDVELLNGILHILVRDELVDHEFIRAHTNGYDDLSAHVAAFDPSIVAARCGIEVAEVEWLAHTIGTASSVLFAWTMGVNHSVQGTETVALINTLAAVTGNIGRVGGAPLSITGQCNAMGSRETSFTSSMPGYRAFDDPGHRRELAALLSVDEARLPKVRGRAYPDIIDGILEGTIRALWIIGTNPVVSFPDRARLEAAFERLDLLVVQDGFETPTTALADIVLPAAIWGEKDGTFTNTERRVSRVRAAVPAPGDATADFDLILEIARRWGVADELFRGWSTPEDAFEEWRRVSADRPCDSSAMTYEGLADGGLQWPCNAETAPRGTARLYESGRVHTPDGRIALRVVHPQRISEPPDAAFPFLLNTGRTVEHWHTRTKTGAVAVLDRLVPDAWLDMHPDDAAVIGVIGEGGTGAVTITSRRGRIGPVRVRPTMTLRRGTVFLPFHFADRCANDLTLAEFDPISREPNYKQCAVRIDAAHIT